MKRLIPMLLILLCMIGSACAAAFTPEEARVEAVRVLTQECPGEEAEASVSDGRTTALVTRDAEDAYRLRLAETAADGAYGLTRCNETLLASGELERFGFKRLSDVDVRLESADTLVLTAAFDEATTIAWTMRQDMTGGWQVYDALWQEKNGVQTLVYHAQLVDGQIEAERKQYQGYFLAINESYPPLPLNMDNSLDNARLDVLYPYD